MLLFFLFLLLTTPLSVILLINSPILFWSGLSAFVSILFISKLFRSRTIVFLFLISIISFLINNKTLIDPKIFLDNYLSVFSGKTFFVSVLWKELGKGMTYQGLFLWPSILPLFFGITEAIKSRSGSVKQVMTAWFFLSPLPLLSSHPIVSDNLFFVIFPSLYLLSLGLKKLSNYHLPFTFYLISHLFFFLRFLDLWLMH